MKLWTSITSDTATMPVGQAFILQRHGRLTSTFAYDKNYLEWANSYPLEDDLPLLAGMWPVDGPLPRAFLDAAPDRWGRNLIDQRHIRTNRASGQAPRPLTDVDYLLGVTFATTGCSEHMEVGACHRHSTSTRIPIPASATPRLSKG
ncbi:MAG: hypothetical protein LBV30_02630 [Propionibacteriaceae bacterium]|jgi:serine/threonine-protein kinase HipA|nr:hypothetical protein [Propionibacteriaceae bacterium]